MKELQKLYSTIYTYICIVLMYIYIYVHTYSLWLLLPFLLTPNIDVIQTCIIYAVKTFIS